jgi:hypothetical protein
LGLAKIFGVIGATAQHADDAHLLVHKGSRSPVITG